MPAVAKAPPDRIEAIAQVLSRRGKDLTDKQIKQAFREGQVTETEIREAQKRLQAEPPPAIVDSRLDPALLSIGDEIGQSIAAIIGVAVAFLPSQSITSSQVHLLRFQPVARGNFAKIEVDGALAILRGAVSLPRGSFCEVRPSDEIGKPGYIDVTIPRKDREYVLFRRQDIGFRDRSGKPPQTIVGKNLYGENVELPWFIHRAIVGASGSGKSTWMHQDVAIQSLWNSPQHLQFAFIDLARRTFGRFQNYAWNFCPPLLDSDQDKWEEFVRAIMTVYYRRAKQFEQCEDILTWNRQNPDKPEPIIMLMVEELGRLNKAFDRDQVDEFLIEIAENGRANGIYLTIAMQRPAADAANGVIHPRVMTTLQTRIAFRCARQTAALVDCPGAVNLLGNGDGLLLHDNEWLRFQAYHMGDDKDAIFSGLDQWARKRYGDRNCYHPPKEPESPVVNPWDFGEPIENPDRAKYDRYLQIKGSRQSDIIRELFPEARDKALNGNTLASYQRKLQVLISQFED